MTDATPIFLGDEFRVNTGTDNSQEEPSVAALLNGGFVVTWTTQNPPQDFSNRSDIKAQLFDENGNSLGNEFTVNSNINDDQVSSSVAALVGGGFVVTWESDSTPGDDSRSGISGRRFDSSGTPLGDDFRVNTSTAGLQWTPSVTGLSDGGFAVAWESESTPGDPDRGVSARRFDALGNPAGDEFRVNDDTQSRQGQPEIAGLSDGGYAVIWSGDEIAARLYDTSGDPVGGEFPVNSGTVGDQLFPWVTALADGGFVAVWKSDNTPSGDNASSAGISGRRFNPEGTPFGNDFAVNVDFQGEQTHPSGLPLPGGAFAVTWEDNPRSGSDGHIFARAFDAGGLPVSTEIRVNQNTESIQSFPVGATLSNGTSAIVWESFDTPGDDSGSGISATLLSFGDGGDGPNTAPTAANDRATTIINQPVAIAVLGNDTDPDGDGLTVIAASDPAHGSTAVNADDTVTYTPDDGFTGADSFTYTVSDGQDGTAEARVDITVGAEAPAFDRIDIFRFFNTKAGGHFFTANPAERDFAASLDGFNDEGVGFEALAAGDPQPEAVDVFRFFNSNAGGHFFTTNPDEREIAAGLDGFDDEGVGFRAFAEPVAGTVPVYRFFNSNAGGHFFTTSTEERDFAAGLDGFQDEGIGFYAFPDIL